jgi:hypothetical protein
VRKENPTYGRTEYQLLVSFRSRPDRDIVVFRVDTRFGGDAARTVYLDRATTPVGENVWKGWAQVVDDLLSSAVIQRYGLQVILLEDEGEGVSLVRNLLH